MGWLKSKTLWFSFLLAILGVLEESQGVVQAVVGTNHIGLVMLGISLATAILRVLTTVPLSEK